MALTKEDATAIRLLEYIQLFQINPTTESRHALLPDNIHHYIDIEFYPDGTLTGYSLFDLYEPSIGHANDTLYGTISTFIEFDVCKKTLSKWLNILKLQLAEFHEKKALRNRVANFIPVHLNKPFRVEGLHSALIDYLKNNPNEKYPAMQWHNRLLKLCEKGLKKEELNRSGILDWLLAKEDQHSIGSTELLEHVTFGLIKLSIIPVIVKTSGPLEFIRVPKDANIKRVKLKLKRVLNHSPYWYNPVLGYWIDEVKWDDLLGEATSWLAVTHDGYPILDNGQRLSFQSSVKDAALVASHHAQKSMPKISALGNWSKYALTGGKDYREWLVTLPFHAGNYHSSHFEHRNILLHIRCDVREGPNNERILLIQELQSDWAQEARRDEDFNPPHPWAKEWPILALKLLLLHACNGEFDGLAWTTGDIQSMRYAGLGDQGLRNLYDKQLPKEANRLLKPFAGSSSSIDIFVPKTFSISPTELGYEVQNQAGASQGRSENWRDVRKFIPCGGEEVLETLHCIHLTSKLRTEITNQGFFAWGNGINKPG
jgi:hypothetical protein